MWSRKIDNLLFDLIGIRIPTKKNINIQFKNKLDNPDANVNINKFSMDLRFVRREFQLVCHGLCKTQVEDLDGTSYFFQGRVPPA